MSNRKKEEREALIGQSVEAVFWEPDRIGQTDQDLLGGMDQGQGAKNRVT